MHKGKIALLGIYPPPIGGVSMHIQRLSDFLETKNIKYTIYDSSGVEKNKNNYYFIKNIKIWLIKYFVVFPEKIVHCHDRNWYVIAILSIGAKLHKSKIIVSFHSFREEPEKFNILKKTAFKISMAKVDAFIVDGKNDCDKLFKYCRNKDKIYSIPAFIPPKVNEEDFNYIPQSVWGFMDTKDIKIVGNASQISFYKNEDLYGIDMCIELTKLLKEEYKNKKIGFVFCLPQVGDKEYYNKLKLMVQEYDLQNEFLFVNELMPLYPIISKSSIFVRPTNTDGESISVREALSLRIPTVCSDASERPEGVIVFKTRDNNDLFDKVSYTINNYKDIRENLMNFNKNNSGDSIVSIYNALL